MLRDANTIRSTARGVMQVGPMRFAETRRISHTPCDGAHFGCFAPQPVCRYAATLQGFVLTGRDLLAGAAYARIWKERREPMPLETSVPGVFAAGDVRAGAMNRVASAVGEGSMVAIRSRIPGTDPNRFTLFVVSSSRDLVGRALLEMKHERDA
jgi:hypothetical protein